ncbi:MAG TPA: hypothetical protein VGR61_09050 [Candidatus Dormibacteraeota bacterium]|nr:hypothetical protein [Candidatus Dormibacteraeota bacterium]
MPFPLRPSRGSVLPKLLASVAFLALSLTLTVLPAHAAAPAPAGSTGYDISWPQCPSSFPTRGSFAIVGVTNGLAFSANPCLGGEYAWASSRQYAAGLYINTGNPWTASSKWSVRAGSGPRPCTKANLAVRSNVDCAYNYGWNAAADALSTATASVGTAARTLSWWLDVEIGNSWNGTAAANSSTVQGDIDYLRSQGTGTVGIYSTGYQWAQITGGYTVPSSPSAAAAPDWLAGASSVSNAASLCNPANSFSGGPVQLVQYPDSGFNGNYVCGAPPAPTPDYSLAAATPTSHTVVQSASTSYTVSIARTGGFTDSVTLSVTGLPTGASGTFSPNPASWASSSSSLSVTTSSTTTLGSYPLTITGVGGSLTHITSVTLVVQAAPTPDYSLAAVTPASHTVVQGASTSYTVSIASTGGFTGWVTLSVTGLPTGASPTFNPNPASGTSSSLSVKTSSTTPAGSYVLTIAGTSGSLTRTITVTLVVAAANDCNNC